MESVDRSIGTIRELTGRFANAKVLIVLRRGSIVFEMAISCSLEQLAHSSGYNIREGVRGVVSGPTRFIYYVDEAGLLDK